MYPIEKVWSDWKIVKLIGEGSFGKVYEIVRNNYNIEEHSAMKVVQIPNSTAEVQSLKNEGIDQGSLREYYLSLVDDFSREIAVMAKLKGNPGGLGYHNPHGAAQSAGEHYVTARADRTGGHRPRRQPV